MKRMDLRVPMLDNCHCGVDDCAVHVKQQP
jgi:hypothetical protein